jgi:hypothetical protein
MKGKLKKLHRLRSWDIQKGLRECAEYRLLRGLNGGCQPPIGNAKADDLLPHDPLAIKRVRHFLEDLKAAVDPDDALGLSDEALGLPSSLNRARRYLKRYPQHTDLAISPGTGRITAKTVFCGEDAWENNAMDEILNAFLNTGELWRLRCCPSCKNTWFYAMRAAQRYCSAACRQKALNRTPEFKKKRAEYMSRFRSDEKKKDQKAKDDLAAQLRRKARSA